MLITCFLDPAPTMDHSHGVVFTPQSVATPELDVAAFLDQPQLRYIRIYWVDFVNIRRCRIVPVAHFKALLKSNRPGVNIAKVCLGLIGLHVAPGFVPVGEYLYAIDLKSLRPCPFAPGHAAVLGQFEEKTPLAGTVAVELCPRTLLRGVESKIKTVHKTEFLVGFETEFILLDKIDPVNPVNVHDWSASVGLLAGSREALVLEEIGDAVTAAGISLQMIHAEAAPGQYEVVTGPLTPLAAADALVYTREIIVQIAAKHGLHATFVPRPFMYSAGSSAHAHISVHTANEQKSADGLSTHESQFLAGVLSHLRAIVALTLPTNASYKRMTDGVWSGGTYVNYGTENREAPIRLTNATSPASRNFEIRFVDGTANPHLALAAILAGGLLGFDAQQKLEMQDCPGPKSAAELTEQERLALGITTRMPLSVEEGQKSLEEDGALKAVLGTEFVEKYLAVNRTLQTLLVNEADTEDEALTRVVKFY
ncbi:1,2-dihydroxy-3-keto-5-methylthiopentene dioxygenase [Mycena indigotica]|uniref:Glutamine synthetase n=1 Tax=Mycena indigotica TaxID=2126181 RepID=A0A8H6W0U7_9AGAR|nr:1,2-dihydroxy-3-keto-5-methylthiopentene dioxygenase [Mycena indigotica]KAF7297453.1 1,2-dihydroxy-3-keto-5-methylthiopentene dioxygenase [Mycena indigotica]